MREAQKLIDLWPAQGGKIQYRLPLSGDDWSPDDSPVARYIKVLGYLGIDDPTNATDFYQQALTLREASNKAQIRQHDAGTELAQRLAERKVQLDEISTELAKSGAKDAYEAALRERQVIYNAARASYAAAVRAIHTYGEASWMKLLKPLAAKAVEEPRDEALWMLVHKLARILRDTNLAGLATLVRTGTEYRLFDEEWRFMVGRPDLYHQWRLRHAKRSNNMSFQRAGQYVFTLSVVMEGPDPKFTDMESSWLPGIYTAAEVIDITERIKAEQDAVIDRAAAGELDPMNGASNEEGQREPSATANPPDAVRTTGETGTERQGDRGSRHGPVRGTRRGAEAEKGA